MRVKGLAQEHNAECPGGTPLLGLNGDVRPDRVWFSGFFVLNGVYISPNFVLNRVYLLGPKSNKLGLYACRGVTSRIFTNSSVLLTYVDFGIDTKLNSRSKQASEVLVYVL